MLEIFTDGSAHPNPGPGGFGCVFVSPEGEVIETYSKGQKYTTNNEQELKGILYAACRAVLSGEPATIYSDSAYSVNICTSWMYSWKQNGWLKGDNKEPKNLELIKEIYNILSKHKEIKIEKVKGHSTVKFNNMADKLATGAK